MYFVSYRKPGGRIYILVCASRVQLREWIARNISDPAIHWRISNHNREWIESSYHDSWQHIEAFPMVVDRVLYKGGA